MKSEAFWYRHPSGRVFRIDLSPDESSWALYIDDVLVCDGFGGPAEVAFRTHAKALDEDSLNSIRGCWVPQELERWDTVEPENLSRELPNANPYN